MGIIELLIVVLLLLWLFGYFGRGRMSRGPDLTSSAPWGGSWIHLLVVLAVILVILRLLQVI